MRALERLTLAAMAGDEESEQDAWLDVRPKSGGGFSTRVTSRPELFQALVRFADGLDAAERLIFELEAQGTDDWKPILQMLLDQFFPKGKSWWAAPDLESLRTIVVREAETARRGTPFRPRSADPDSVPRDVELGHPALQERVGSSATHRSDRDFVDGRAAGHSF